MLYLALCAVALWIGATVYRRSPGVQRGRWRVGAGLIAVVVMAAGGFLASRGEWAVAAAFIGLGAVLALGARSQRGPSGHKARPSPRGLTASEARAILGVDDLAAPEDIRAAYMRLMRMAHPDRGGTSGLAAQLNAARDRLLDGR